VSYRSDAHERGEVNITIAVAPTIATVATVTTTAVGPDSCAIAMPAPVSAAWAATHVTTARGADR